VGGSVALLKISPYFLSKKIQKNPDKDKMLSYRRETALQGAL